MNAIVAMSHVRGVVAGEGEQVVGEAGTGKCEKS